MFITGSAIIRFIASTFENFNISVSNYLKANAYSSVTPEHFFHAIQETNNFPLESDAFDILSTWTYQPGYPLITMIIDYEHNTANITQVMKNIIVKKIYFIL